MRKFTVISYRCTECGSRLAIRYMKDVDTDSHEKHHDYSSDGVTGADKVEMGVWIEPCHRCMNKAHNDFMNALHRAQHEVTTDGG